MEIMRYEIETFSLGLLPEKKKTVTRHGGVLMTQIDQYGEVYAVIAIQNYLVKRKFEINEIVATEHADSRFVTEFDSKYPGAFLYMLTEAALDPEEWEMEKEQVMFASVNSEIRYKHKSISQLTAIVHRKTRIIGRFAYKKPIGFFSESFVYSPVYDKIFTIKETYVPGFYVEGWRDTETEIELLEVMHKLYGQVKK